MIPLAIAILWFLIGVIVLGCVVWIALWVIHQVFPNVPPKIDQVAWGIFAILCIICILMAISGGGFEFGPHRL